MVHFCYATFMLSRLVMFMMLFFSELETHYMFDIMGKKMPVFILPQDSIYRLGLCVDLFLVDMPSVAKLQGCFTASRYY